jgi:hypothetical protein
VDIIIGELLFTGGFIDTSSLTDPAGAATAELDLTVVPVNGG